MKGSQRFDPPSRAHHFRRVKCLPGLVSGRLGRGCAGARRGAAAGGLCRVARAGDPGGGRCARRRAGGRAAWARAFRGGLSGAGRCGGGSRATRGLSRAAAPFPGRGAGGGTWGLCGPQTGKPAGRRGKNRAFPRAGAGRGAAGGRGGAGAARRKNTGDPGAKSFTNPVFPDQRWGRDRGARAYALYRKPIFGAFSLSSKS